jgi:hypothetical protein
VIAALFNIMDDDVDNTESEANEMCAVMEYYFQRCINATGRPIAAPSI